MLNIQKSHVKLGTTNLYIVYTPIGNRYTPIGNQSTAYIYCIIIAILSAVPTQ